MISYINLYYSWLQELLKRVENKDKLFSNKIIVLKLRICDRNWQARKNETKFLKSNIL
jgi:hypothetical protein